MNRNREITITIQGEEEKKQCNERDTQLLLIATRNKAPRQAAEDIIALKKLRSGDYTLSALTEEAKNTLVKDSNWTKEFASTATIRQTTYPVSYMEYG